MKAFIKLMVVMAIIFCATSSYATDAINKNKELVKQAIIYTIENKDPNMDYNKYISKDYVQYVDGKTFNFAQFVEHMQRIKTDLKSMSVSIQDMVAEGDKVVSEHIIKATKKDNSEITAKVIAIITVKDGKIISCDELTHLLEGKKEDNDMGSRR